VFATAGNAMPWSINNAGVLDFVRANALQAGGLHGWLN